MIAQVSPCADVMAGGGHAPAGLNARIEPRDSRFVSNRLRPGAQVDLRHRMEAGSERANPLRLVVAGQRLVANERRNRDVVVRARGCVRGELLAKANPIRGGVEDRFGRQPAIGRKAALSRAESPSRGKGIRMGGVEGLDDFEVDALDCRERSGRGHRSSPEPQLPRGARSETE